MDLMNLDFPSSVPDDLEQAEAFAFDDPFNLFEGEEAFSVLNTDRTSAPEARRAGVETLEEMILCHPLYPKLLDAVFDCRKIGEDSHRSREISEQKQRAQRHISALKKKSKMSEGNNLVSGEEKERLTTFLESYIALLSSFKTELQVTFTEAEAACREFYGQICQVMESGDNGIDSDTNGGLSNPDCQTALKTVLKRKYAEKIRQLHDEFSKKPKKGKLPVEATQLLKDWWNENFAWPYPSDEAKKLLADKTGLETIQINNWFINQRKRHWHKHFPEGLPQTPEESARRLNNKGLWTIPTEPQLDNTFCDPNFQTSFLIAAHPSSTNPRFGPSCTVEKHVEVDGTHSSMHCFNADQERHQPDRDKSAMVPASTDQNELYFTRQETSRPSGIYTSQTYSSYD